MRRTNTHHSDPVTSQGSAYRVAHSERSQASQIDFLTAIVVVIVAIAMYNVGAGVVLSAQGDTVSATDQVTMRAQERIAEDLLVNESGDEVLSPGCSRAFFTAASNATCNIPAGTGPAYYQDIVGIGEYSLNVTLRNETAIVDIDPSNGSRPFRHAAGDPYPKTGEVIAIKRVVSYGQDITGDGAVDYYILTVRVWEDQ